MIIGNELEEQVYSQSHIAEVLAEIGKQFPKYFETFKNKQPVQGLMDKAIQGYLKDRERYREYLSIPSLMDYEDDPNAFKRMTRNKCVIIHGCLMSRDDVMKKYKISFNNVAGRDLLNTVRNLAEFGLNYAADFNDDAHEKAEIFAQLGLKGLEEDKYYCIGVVGYGIQSALLYGRYGHAFAYRAQDAVWSLYFLSNRLKFGLQDDSEFLMVHPRLGTCEQNYFYPPELFGFYSLKVYLMLKEACANIGVTLYPNYRYVYLSQFFSSVATDHRNDINTLKWSSDNVENHWF
jgi:hypothetical protein